VIFYLWSLSGICRFNTGNKSQVLGPILPSNVEVL